jgi:hypothetical protein
MSSDSKGPVDTDDDALLTSEDRIAAEKIKIFLLKALRDFLTKIPDEFTIADDILTRLKKDDEYLTSLFMPRMKCFSLPEGMDVVVQVRQHTVRISNKDMCH